MTIDWDDAFDNSGHVVGADEMPTRWAAKAQTYRAQMVRKQRTVFDLAYGPGERNRLDLFHPESNSHGLIVFVHGGYWQRFDKSYWSHLAAGMNRLGWTVAIPSYTLAPAARIGQITTEVAAAIHFAAEHVDGGIRLVGHSAGGHLVSRMLCSDQPLKESVQKRVAQVVSISGIHDLRPLLQTHMNQTLKLDQAEADRESPSLLQPDHDKHITFWVGAQERPELIRQTRLIAELWEDRGARVATRYETGRDHFSVVEALADSRSALVRELVSRKSS